MRRKIDLLILFLVLAGGFVAARNAIAIGDWWHARSYQSSSDIQKIAQDAGMSETGEKLFYRFSPELISQEKLDTKCEVDKLGCVEGNSLYILEHDTEKQYLRSVVTAAHEMLHIAWSRLSFEKRYELELLIDRELATPKAQNIRERLQGYPEEERINEAHSFIGSELENISDKLESHYDLYFSDRTKSTRAYTFSAKN